MNALNYLESRFVSSQTQLGQSRGLTLAHGESQAIMAWMWVALKLTVVFHFFAILAHYLAVILHLTDRPMSAQTLADRYRAGVAQQADTARKIAEEMTKNAASGQVGPPVMQ